MKRKEDFEPKPTNQKVESSSPSGLTYVSGAAHFN